MKKTRNEILDELAREEARLAELKAEAEKASARVATLRQEFDALGATEVQSPSADGKQSIVSPTTNTEKIALFRSLFSGRKDVFPKRWENPKTGRSGYSPACSNEWIEGLCGKKKGGKRRTTCGDCPDQSFVPVSDAEVADHLRGRQVMGVYPLLPDETCWFLAADFDGGSWREDVSAFAKTCRAKGFHPAVERSRSGNGAHVWFFFSAPVPAIAARKMGCHLITETMSRRHQLSMTSYDRLFPNQDTMPKGGFGNLIALPLQRGPRNRDNSVFLDESFQPFSDQWFFLTGVERLDPATVLAVAEEATRKGRIVGVRAAEPDDGYEDVPWDKPPSGETERLNFDGPLPTKVEAVLSQRLFVKKAGLPSPVINRIKRLAAFQNPEFYKKQGMRISTALTPRVIACAEELDRYVALPRGCVDEVHDLLDQHGVALAIKDERREGDPVDLTFKGTLTPMQLQAAEALLAHDTGTFVAPPGVGKTVVGIYLAVARGRSTLVLVHRKPLLEQWVAQVSLFLGIKPSEVGRIGGGRHKPNGMFDVAMIQSLVRKGKVDDIVDSYGHVIMDECHHVGAFSFERVMSEVKAKYVTGLTATPLRRDGHHPILRMQLGPVRFSIDPKSQDAAKPFDQKLLVRETGFTPKVAAEDAGIQELYAMLGEDEKRNQLIFDDVVAALEQGRSPILLTERRDHLEHFAQRLQSFVKHLVVLKGGMGVKKRREVLEHLSSIPDDEERLLLATGRYIGEGFDDHRLDTLFLALPVSWKGTLVQYAGRLHRLHPGKREVRIYDYVDRDVPMLMKMFGKRLRGYRSMGYAREEAPLGITPFVEEVVVEYDEDAYPAEKDFFE